MAWLNGLQDHFVMVGCQQSTRHVVHLSELKLPAGVTIPELKLGKEHDLALVIARQLRAEAEPAAAGSADADKK
jgi:large subunit ribosomal protein L25